MNKWERDFFFIKLENLLYIRDNSHNYTFTLYSWRHDKSYCNNGHMNVDQYQYVSYIVKFYLFYLLHLLHLLYLLDMFTLFHIYAMFILVKFLI
jgi:hypothetical protein